MPSLTKISGSKEIDGENIDLTVGGISVPAGELVLARITDWADEMGERGGEDDWDILGSH